MEVVKESISMSQNHANIAPSMPKLSLNNLRRKSVYLGISLRVPIDHLLVVSTQQIIQKECWRRDSIDRDKIGVKCACVVDNMG